MRRNSLLTLADCERFTKLVGFNDAASVFIFSVWWNICWGPASTFDPFCSPKINWTNPNKSWTMWTFGGAVEQWSIECRKSHERIYPLNNTRGQIPQAMRLGCRWLRHWGRTLPRVSMAQSARQIAQCYANLTIRSPGLMWICMDLAIYIYIYIFQSCWQVKKNILKFWLQLGYVKRFQALKCHLHPSKAIMCHAWQGLEYLRAGEPGTGRDKLCCCKSHKNCPNHIV